MSKYTEAIEVLKRNKPTSDPRECGRELCNAVDVAIKALQIADRVSQIDYMEIPTLKIIETKNGVEATANLLETVDAISHNTLLAKIKGEEERIYARGNQNELCNIPTS